MRFCPEGADEIEYVRVRARMEALIDGADELAAIAITVGGWAITQPFAGEVCARFYHRTGRCAFGVMEMTAEMTRTTLGKFSFADLRDHLKARRDELDHIEDIDLTEALRYLTTLPDQHTRRTVSMP